MATETGLPTAVYVIWWGVLLLVLVVIVPLAVALLHRTFLAAWSIRRYLRDMLQAGVGIANNTAPISALKDTIGVAGALVQTAGAIRQHSSAAAAVLAERAQRGRAA